MSTTLRSWLQAEPFTLAMSSGFFGFFAHCGVLVALDQAGLRPAAVRGSSAGALVGACFAGGCPSATLAETLMTLDRRDFWDPAPGLGYLRGAKFRALIASLLRYDTFESAPLPIAVSAYDGLARSTAILRQGPLVPAIYASCAVPLLFHPIRINGRLYWDGGIGDRHGLGDEPSDSRVFYHHLSSRSPWRSAASPALKIPIRPNGTALALADLPRSGPRKLDQGRQAYKRAWALMNQALELPHQPVMRL